MTSEIERFELQTAKKVWDTLTTEEQALLLTSDGTISADEKPELNSLINAGLLMRTQVEGYCVWQGERRYSYHPGYATTPFGSVVHRYGVATAIVEAATSRSVLV